MALDTNITPPTENAHPLRNPYRFFWHVSRPHAGWMFFAIALVVIAASISQLTNYFYKFIVEAVERGDVSSALWWGMIFPAAMFAVQVLYRCSGYVGARWTTHAYKQSVITLYHHATQHSHTYFSNRFSGSITNKIRNVVGAIEEVIPDFLWGQLTSLVAFVTAFAIIVSVDVGAGSAFIGLLVALIVVNSLMAKEKARLSKMSAAIGTRMQGRVVDTFTNISAVRQYTQQLFEESTHESLAEESRTAKFKNWMYTERMLLINSVVLFFGTGAMFWRLITQWSAGFISAGDFVLVLALTANLIGNLLFIGRAFNAMSRTLGEMREGLEDIYVPYDIVDADAAQPLQVTNGTIVWDDVRFNFEANTVFDDFSLTIPGGQRVGLVGSSGAGKSTFVSLLLRQHELGAGKIFIDGQDITTVTQDSLRTAIAVVPQEPLLFHRTIRENIAYGKLDAPDDEIEAVARKAYAHDFISLLPQGYDTLVGERGVKLSGGQKQRVAIARAMLKDAPILILDEATSALDSESEVAIQKALHALMAGKTVIAIAHRLSTLREMDRIIVLDSGKVVEDGTHDALLSYGGVYGRLWEHQSGGFL